LEDDGRCLEARVVRTNYGFAANLEQAITKDLGVFARASWSPGVNEIIGWTDCDQSVSAGALLKGTFWQRPNDVVGVAGVVGGLSSEARAYFAAGRARHFDRRRWAQLPDGEGLRNLLLLQPEQLVECHVRLSTHCRPRLQRRPRAGPRFFRPASHPVLNRHSQDRATRYRGRETSAISRNRRAGVPQLFVVIGVSRWNDPKHFPRTMG
jgi:hypothetical protein